MWRVYVQQHEVLGPWYRRFQNQPGWVTKAAIVAAVLVIGVPILVLTLTAILVGLAVFAVLGLAAQGVRAVRQLFRNVGPAHTTPEPGRRNVRIVRR